MTFLRKSKLDVDKSRSIWYSNKAVAEVNVSAGIAKKKLKSLEKVVDKQQAMWYPTKVAESNTDCESKNFRKKFLTNEMKFAIIAMFRRKAACTL